jgi:hypothetical protein
MGQMPIRRRVLEIGMPAGGSVVTGACCLCSVFTAFQVTFLPGLTTTLPLVYSPNLITLFLRLYHLIDLLLRPSE